MLLVFVSLVLMSVGADSSKRDLLTRTKRHPNPNRHGLTFDERVMILRKHNAYRAMEDTSWMLKMVSFQLIVCSTYIIYQQTGTSVTVSIMPFVMNALQNNELIQRYYVYEDIFQNLLDR